MTTYRLLISSLMIWGFRSHRVHNFKFIPFLYNFINGNDVKKVEKWFNKISWLFMLKIIGKWMYMQIGQCENVIRVRFWLKMVIFDQITPFWLILRKNLGKKSEFCYSTCSLILPGFRNRHTNFSRNSVEKMVFGNIFFFFSAKNDGFALNFSHFLNYRPKLMARTLTAKSWARS